MLVVDGRVSTSRAVVEAQVMETQAAGSQVVVVAMRGRPISGPVVEKTQVVGTQAVETVGRAPSAGAGGRETVWVSGVPKVLRRGWGSAVRPVVES